MASGLSTEQAQAANPSRSAWISANAGSGKTRVLTARVARLLLQGVEPGRILCLTFTRAAAGEMKTRLFSTLGGWAMRGDRELAGDLSDLLEDSEPRFDAGDTERLNHARRLFAQALEYPGGLRIQTMHAFGLALLRRFPLEAGLSPGLRMLEDRRAADLATAAFEAALIRIRTGPEGPRAAYRMLVENATPRMLEELRGSIIQHRGLYQRFAQNSSLDEMAATIRDLLGADGRSAAECVADELGRAGQMAEFTRPLLEAIDTCGSKKNQEHATGIRAGLAMLAAGDPLRALARLRGVYFIRTGDRPRAFPVKAAQQWLEDHDAGNCLPQACDLLQEAEAVRRRATVAGSSIAVATFALDYLKEYEAAKQTEAGLDYEEIVEATHRLLSRSEMKEWVRYRLDGNIDHVLVDEAQDTSPAQWQTVQRLVEEYFSGEPPQAGPRTVFAVGDEKQSIFSFQGADPRVFGKTRDWMEARTPKKSSGLFAGQLATSYRCAPAILKFVDRVFSRESYEAPDGMQGPDGGAEAWAEGLLGWDEPLLHHAVDPQAAGRVEVWDLVEAKPEEEGPDSPDSDDRPVEATGASPAARTAQQITQRIGSWLREGRLLPATGRPIRPGDIMILLQRRGEIGDELIRQLRLEGIRVGGSDRIKLRESLVVQDMLALAAFALLPEDDHTLAVVLRSPLCGISEEDLYELAWNRAPALLWQRLQENADTDTARYGAARNFLRDMIRAATEGGPLDFLEQALIRHGGRRKLLTRLGPDAVEPLDALLEEALGFENGSQASLEEFVAAVENGTTEIKAGAEARDAGVRIMTIHSAKGLEAPVVILPDVTRVPQFGARERIFRDRTGDGPDVPLFVRGQSDDVPRTQELRDRAVQREREESYRLFYVALTRAREWLIICGARKGRNPNAKCWYYRALNAAHQLGRPVEPDTDGARLGEAFSGLLVEQGEPVAAKAEPVPVPEMAEEIPPWALQDVPPDPPRLRLNPSRMTDPVARMAVEDDEELPEDDTQISAPLDRGNLIHLLLERLTGMPAGETRSQLGKTLATLFGGTLKKKERAEILDRAEHILDATETAWIFAPDGLAEAPFSVPLSEAEGSLDGRIDRLVFDGARVLAVDFKSDAEVPDRPESTGESYLIQLGAYRHAMKAIWPERKAATAILWTGGDTPQLMEMPDLLVDEAFARAYEAQAGTTSMPHQAE